MSDTFLSYATADRERARQLAQALAARGWNVWWDREIAFGESFDRVIERELARARSVIVLWSNASAESDWVRNEARKGLRRGVLIPVQIEPVELPLEFSNVQTADLSDWHADQAHPAFDKLIQRLKALLGEPVTAVLAAGGASAAAQEPDSHPVRGERRRDRNRAAGRKKKAVWVAAILGLLAGLGGGYWAWILTREQATSKEASAPPPGIVAEQAPLPGPTAGRGDAVDPTVATAPMGVMPALVGQTLDRARQASEDAGLTLGRVSHQQTQAAPPGTVIQQSVEAGAKVGRGSAIDLTVAAVVEVEVPNLAGMPLGRAKTLLQRVGLKLGSTVAAGLFADVDSSEPKVRSHTPNAGTRVARGTTVQLTVMEPGAQVPALVRGTLDEAKSVLGRAGLTLGTIKEEAAANARPGIVVEQSPSAGNVVARGERVDLTVAARATTVTMPNLIGTYHKDVYSILHKVGLRGIDLLEKTPPAGASRVRAGAVYEQSPMAGQNVTLDTRVRLSYAPMVKSSAALIVMPDLVGSHVNNAHEVLRGLGITKFTSDRKVTADAPEFRVLSQSPSAGTQVTADTPIHLIYAVRSSAFPVKPAPASWDEARKVCPAVCAEQKMKWKSWTAQKPMYCYCAL